MTALVTVAAAFMSAACGREYPSGVKAFIALPRNQRAAVLEQLPLEERVDVYVSAMLAVHPPDLQLADSVAAGGSRVLPVLVDRLRSDTRAVVQVDLLYVILRMQQMSEADIAGDAELVSTLDGVVAAIEDPGWKEAAFDLVSRIRART